MHRAKDASLWIDNRLAMIENLVSLIKKKCDGARKSWTITVLSWQSIRPTRLIVWTSRAFKVSLLCANGKATTSVSLSCPLSLRLWLMSHRNQRVFLTATEFPGSLGDEEVPLHRPLGERIGIYCKWKFHWGDATTAAAVAAATDIKRDSWQPKKIENKKVDRRNCTAPQAQAIEMIPFVQCKRWFIWNILARIERSKRIVLVKVRKLRLSRISM